MYFSLCLLFSLVLCAPTPYKQDTIKGLDNAQESIKNPNVLSRWAAASRKKLVSFTKPILMHDERKASASPKKSRNPIVPILKNKPGVVIQNLQDIDDSPFSPPLNINSEKSKLGFIVPESLRSDSSQITIKTSNQKVRRDDDSEDDSDVDSIIDFLREYKLWEI